MDIRSPPETARMIAAENVLLNQNRHSTCVDCHDAHASRVTAFLRSPAIRCSQN